MEKGTITINIEGISFEETERYRGIITFLIASGAFNVRGGSVTVQFDPLGLAQEVEVRYIRKVRREAKK